MDAPAWAFTTKLAVAVVPEKVRRGRTLPGNVVPGEGRRSERQGQEQGQRGASCHFSLHGNHFSFVWGPLRGLLPS